MSSTRTQFPHQGRPQAGLYDSNSEHDACGVGFVVDIKGRKSHTTIERALTILDHLEHRGASGSEINTGDGAGILIQIPDPFLRRECAKLGILLPAAGEYGTGLVFLPPDEAEAETCERELARIVAEEGQSLLGWRDLPIDDSAIGPTARACQPAFRQVFIGRAADITDGDAFERRLYVIRKRLEHAIWGSTMREKAMFYIPTLSHRTMVYKGMLNAAQVKMQFPDLSDPLVESALALVHQRFSTNTFPSWPLAHPFRYIAHNGEINTLRGNANWMRAREALCASPVFGEDLKKLFPIVHRRQFRLGQLRPGAGIPAYGRPPAAARRADDDPGGLEWPSAPWTPPARPSTSTTAASMEPWDGPACIAFTDGRIIGAVLDRNGLRPSRYYVTEGRHGRDGVRSGRARLPAGEHRDQGAPASRAGFSWSTLKPKPHRRSDAETQAALHRRNTRTQEWLQPATTVPLDVLPPCRDHVHAVDHDTVLRTPAGLRLHARGPAHPDAADGARRARSRIGSMGTDAALAVLSSSARAALRLLQAAVRAGHQPAARRHPRRSWSPRSRRPSARRATCSNRRRRAAAASNSIRCA
jgi:glutamate synthase (NADPH/NADH) large chain